MCRAQWPVTSTYIFKVIQAWLCNKLLKYGTSCHVCFTACTVLDGLFPYLAQTITSIRECVACKNLWPWRTSSRSFSYDFTIKLLKCDTSCCVCSAALKVLDGFFLCLAQMITSMRGCVACNDLWSWPISSRLFNCEIGYYMDCIYMWPKYNPGGDDVSCTVSTVSRSVCQRSRSYRSFTFLQLGRGYLSRSPIYNL